MADAKAYPVVTLVAIERGFAMGRMVEPGQRFQFDTSPPEAEDGKQIKLAKDGSRRIPKWAALPNDPRVNKPKPVAGDLKPKDAQVAVRKKVAAVSGE